ncbi:MAG: sigma-54-dependent transcriptional regulator [Thermodesulfobacteriota bacterium]
METFSVLVVDDEEDMRHMLSLLLRREGYDVASVEDGKKALKAIEKGVYDFILCDIRMPDMSGLDLLRDIKERELNGTVIMMSAYGTIDIALEAMNIGAYDYISKPFKTDEVVLTLKKAEERERLRKENIRLRAQVEKKYSFDNMIARSDVMLKMFDVIRKVADYNTTVLITGGSGTGKELVAKSIHFNSKRKRMPFVPVNCGAIPENLLESELFGYVKGAFTDAGRDKKGLFEEANGGTIFLDEIGELPKNLQVKLLRVLQEGEVRRVGDVKNIRIDVRVIAATVRDLSKEVNEGVFREDLFYRLNVMPIHIPLLRERKEDITLLVNYFLEKHKEKHGKDIKGISNTCMKDVMDYPWPGNVRELENIIERAVILETSEEITTDSLSLNLDVHKGEGAVSPAEGTLSLKVAQRLLEKEMIQRALKEARGNRSKAARFLEISYRALLYKIKDYEMEL